MTRTGWPNSTRVGDAVIARFRLTWLFPERFGPIGDGVGRALPVELGLVDITAY